MILIFKKSHVSGYIRRNGTVVKPYQNSRHPAVVASRTARKLGGRLVASAINKNIAPVKGVNIIGQAVGSVKNLARLCQIFRNPEYETFRVFYERNGRIVGQCGISARLPGSTPFPAGFEDEVKKQASRLKADRIWLLHNHPSGDPSPSGGDQYKTVELAKSMPLIAGHVIINSGKFSAWERGKGWSKNIPLKATIAYDWADENEFPEQHDAATPNSWMMAYMNGDVSRLADMAKAIQGQERVVIASVAGADMHVRSLSEFTIGDLSDPSSRTEQFGHRERTALARMMLIRLLSIQTGATNGAFAVCDEDHFKSLEWLFKAAVLREVIAVRKDGLLRLMSREIPPDQIVGDQRSLGGWRKEAKVVEMYFEREGYIETD
jgi:hypothetical protein